MDHDPLKMPPKTTVPLTAPGAPIRKGQSAKLLTDDIIKGWMKREEKEEILKVFPYSKGSLEIWVQVEIEYLFKKHMGLPIEKKIPFREEKVYEGTSEAADFVFEQTCKEEL